uniref:protein NRT1/ PTR FAMILY 5.10-like isoform X2 n=1 Tax=Fragaria vesca subsp. vesca TaxID=101020 RepID=UPI0005C926BA|nr:PREDICTED: protein NRT1/ PTR FAMILY 5.10-like isoform X2 [Fragaria vesca subsp. vesca]
MVGNSKTEYTWFQENTIKLTWLSWHIISLISPFHSDHNQLMATSPETQAPLLDDVVHGVFDCNGNAVRRSTSGGWSSASFIIWVEVAERVAFFGICTNLISFLTGPLGQSTATAAQNVNMWIGTAALLPLLGAFVADSLLGRYRTIIAASLLYILGLGLLIVSAVLPSNSKLQELLFFFSLYLLAIALGGHKPSVQAFGVDQFDNHDPEERKAKSSFFNWWFWCIYAGPLFTLPVLTYIQDNLSWDLAFGILCILMVLSLLIFILGTRHYRYSLKRDDESPFVRIGKVFVAAIRNWRTTLPISSIEESRGTLSHQSSQQLKFLNKALLASDDLKENGKFCTVAEVEEAKAILRLFPIWVTSLPYAIVIAQFLTFFTKQGATMDRTLVPGFDIPAASLQTIVNFITIISIPIYDRIFVPIARAFTREPSGITMLQRIGTGMFISIICMVVAALVEMQRLQTAKDFDLVDKPSARVPMSIWWLGPQYLLIGLADVFTIVGLQEFFYDQAPNDLKSVGLALFFSINGVGNFLSSYLISGIEAATSWDIALKIAKSK